MSNMSAIKVALCFVDRINAGDINGIVARMTDQENFVAYLLRRDRRLNLEYDIAWANQFMISYLLAAFPDAMFVVLIRDLYTWLQSIVGHLIGREIPPDVRSFLDWCFKPERHPHTRHYRGLETHGVGLQQLRTDPVFEAIGSPATVQAVDEILGAGRWKRPRHWGQLLISFPAAERSWTVPSAIWHTDFGFLTPPDRIFGLLVFSFLSEVQPHSGGTVVMAGSHRLVGRFVASQPRKVREKLKRVRKAFLRSEPWLKALVSNEDDPKRVERFMETEHLVSGVPLRVVELTGKAGDVVVGHPWLLHAPALNCGGGPRIMCVQRVHLASDRRGDSVSSTRNIRRVESEVSGETPEMLESPASV